MRPVTHINPAELEANFDGWLLRLDRRINLNRAQADQNDSNRFIQISRRIPGTIMLKFSETPDILKFDLFRNKAYVKIRRPNMIAR
jgi:hypothetical protein